MLATQADDSYPKPIGKINPIYPTELWEEGLEGNVKLLVEVLSSGNVGNIKILESPHELFSKSAIDAVSSWIFEPAIEHGKAVTKTITIPLHFKTPRFTNELEEFEKLIPFLERNPFIEIDSSHVIVKLKDLGGEERFKRHLLPYVVCYPKKLEKTGVIGTAETSFLIGPEGDVFNPEIIEIDVPELKLSALKTLVGMKFEPFGFGDHTYIEAFMSLKIKETKG